MFLKLFTRLKAASASYLKQIFSKVCAGFGKSWKACYRLIVSRQVVFCLYLALTLGVTALTAENFNGIFNLASKF